MYSDKERREIVKHVCSQLEQKRPLYRILLEDEGMPSRDAFYEWRDQDQEIADKVARARELGIEAHIEDIIEIADDKTDDPASRKVRIYGRERAAQMLAPKKFGQKLDLTSDGEKIQTAQPVLIDARIQSLLMQAEHRAQLPAPDYGDLFD